MSLINTSPKPWIIYNGEMLEVTSQWFQQLERIAAFKMAKETYEHIRHYDNPDYMVWFEAGILTVTDQAQDVKVLERLTLGMQYLSQFWPTSTERAQRQVERSV